jgi:hypothetical protein
MIFNKISILSKYCNTSRFKKFLNILKIINKFENYMRKREYQFNFIAKKTKILHLVRLSL